MADVVVTHNPGQSRYEARVGDTLAGFAQYQLTSELIVFTHTEVDDAFEGQGVGSVAGPAGARRRAGVAGPTGSCRCAPSSRAGSAATATTSTSCTARPPSTARD